MNETFFDYFRCPETFAQFAGPGELSREHGYFIFDRSIGYGRLSGGSPARHFCRSAPDVSDAVDCQGGRLRLPFDLSEVVTNLRFERYHQNSHDYLERLTSSSLLRRTYYMVRPVLPFAARRYLQKLGLSGWKRIEFPQWPVDFNVDRLMRSVFAMTLKARGFERTPFIWFWPEGAASCAIMTHDVESKPGLDFCGRLMDLDDQFGIKSSFQIVPEERYEDPKWLTDSIRSRGFEANIHDLNHDGFLFHDKQNFLKRAARINEYARDFQSRGFRAGAMYREQSWYEALEFSYDMSVPNVAHLEPQRGGCCTVMPYFVGNILELPLTTIQDYSLFYILDDYSIGLWTEQIRQIMSENGLVSFITHPDYLIEDRPNGVYRDLLQHLSELRASNKLWIALPSDVDRWWRSRHQMVLTPVGNSWRIDGPDSNRARVAYATLEDGRLVYTLDGAV